MFILGPVKYKTEETEGAAHNGQGKPGESANQVMAREVRALMVDWDWLGQWSSKCGRRLAASVSASGNLLEICRFSGPTPDLLDQKL